MASEVDVMYLTPDVFKVMKWSPCLNEQTAITKMAKKISLFIVFMGFKIDFLYYNQPKLNLIEIILNRLFKKWKRYKNVQKIIWKVKIINSSKDVIFSGFSRRFFWNRKKCRTLCEHVFFLHLSQNIRVLYIKRNRIQQNIVPIKLMVC